MSLISPYRNLLSRPCLLLARSLSLGFLLLLGGNLSRAQSVRMIQHTSEDAGTATSATLAFPSGNTAGNWIGVCIRAGAVNETFTVTDSNGNTYHKAIQFNETGNGNTLGIFYAENIKGGANTIQVSGTVAATLRLAILEYSGVVTSGSLDVIATAQGNSASPYSGNAVTTSVGDLLLGAIMTSDPATFTAGSGYNIEERVPTEPNTKLIAEDQIQANSGAASASASLGAADFWAAGLAAFKAASKGVLASPNITNLSPSSGPVGVSVTITGTNFGGTQGSSTVMFNGTAGTPTSWSATSIVVPVPSGAKTGNVTVTVAGVTSNGVSFMVGTIAPLAFVQANYASPQTPQTKVAVTYTQAQTAGDLNVVVVGWNDSNAQINSVTDSTGNPYELAVGPTVQSGTATQAIYYAKNITAAAANSNTVTVTFNAAANYPDIRIAEYSGIDPLAPVDVVAAAQGNGATSNSGAVATGNANDLLVGANLVQTGTTGPGSGYTSRVITSPDGDVLEDSIVTATGSYSATAPVAGGAWIMQMVAFRRSTGAGDTTPPTAPSGITATASGTQINLSWTASTDNVAVTGYRVERCQGSGCTTFAQIATTTSTGYTDTGLTANTSYSYRVRATDAAGNLSPYSNVVTATTPSPTATTITYVQGNYATPQTPQTTVSVPFTAAQAVGDLNVVAVGWNDSTATVSTVRDTAGNVYTRAVGPTILNGSLSQSIYYAKNIVAAVAGANVVTVIFSTAAVTPDIRILEYRGADQSNPVDVTAANGGTGISDSSGSATTTNPTDLIFGANIVTTVTTGPGTGFTTRLLTSPDGDIAEDRMVTTTGSYSATSNGLNAAGAWIMQMVAFRTPTGTGAGDTTPPAAPSGLTATASGTQINLGWTASTDNVGVTGYRVERCQGSGCTTFAQIATTTSTGYTDTGLTANTSYSYRVRATDAAGNNSGYSNTASAITQGNSLIAVTISPRRGGLTLSQTLTLTASVTNDVGAAGVTWTKSGGSFSGTPSLTSAMFFSPAAGSFTITATSLADNTKSASATIGVTDLAGIFTQRYDIGRTGQNQQEYALTASTVNNSTFGKLFSCPVDGEVYAQPLYVANLVIGGGTRNTIFVSTENDSVYAFDADTSPCVQRWTVSLLNGGTPVSPADTGETGDINKKIGITGTPVIDPTSKTLYVVSKTKEGSVYHQRLHALSLTDGSEKFNGPVDITAALTVPGNGDTGDATCPSTSGHVPFCPLREGQRPGLLLLGGTVYIAWASHGDYQPYHGWVIGFNASNLSLAPVLFNTTPNGGLGGIWQTGTAPAADASGNIYVITGNGTFDTSTPRTNYGDSFIKLSTAGGLSLADFFTPSDQATLSSGDLDLGSGGPVALPDSAGSGALPHLLVGGDKLGILYLINRDSMTGFHSGGDQILQEVMVTSDVCVTCGIFSTPAFWQGNLYVVAIGDVLKRYSLSNAVLSATPVQQASDSFGFPGASPVVSSNGTTNGIVWAVNSTNNGTPNPGNSSGPAVLFAYDAISLSKLFSSSATSGAGAAGNAVKFVVPTVANGKVYLGTQTELSVFGLLP